MSPIDLYIRRATLGLPKRARLDTAAELRVHLNERAVALTSQGLDRSEAEHLAVEYMGPIEPVNRQFLGHVLTPRLGWILAALLFLGLAAWAASNFLFAPAEIAAPRGVIPNDLLPLLGEFSSLEVTMPRDSRTLSLALAQGDGELFSSASTILDGFASELRPNERTSLTFTIGFPIAAIAQAQCEPGSRPLFVSDASGHMTACVSVPGDTGSWQHMTADGLDVVYDSWQPLLIYKAATSPTAIVAEGDEMPASLDWSPVVSDPSEWLVLSAFTSRAPLQDLGELPPPPTGSKVAAKFSWLLPQRGD